MSSEYRGKALAHHGHECAVCGGSEVVVHHRDGDRNNNDVSNLIPLCNSCHRNVHSGTAENDVAEKLVRELGKTPQTFEPTTLYLPEETRTELRRFLKRITLDHPEIEDAQKRELHTALIKEAMEHPEEIADGVKARR